MTPEEKKRCEAKTKVLKALAHPTRLWMVEKLQEGDRCVCEFVDEIDADFSTVSKHLSVLKQAGIVSDEKQGKQVYYHLEAPCLFKFLGCVEDVVRSRAKEELAWLNV